MLFGLTTTFSSLVQAIHRIRDSKACSFEPTGSSLGIGHGYQVPTMHDSWVEPSPGDEEKGLVGAGAQMGRRDSAQSKEEAVVSWPAAVARSSTGSNSRPHRPWSELPER